MATPQRPNDSVSNQERKPLDHTLHHQIRQEWNALWNQRITDKTRSEDVARRNYNLLFVEKGTVIRATKDFKPPNFEEILKRNEGLLGIRLTRPRPQVGGWRKFSKDVLAQQPRWSSSSKRRKRRVDTRPTRDLKQTGLVWGRKG